MRGRDWLRTGEVLGAESLSVVLPSLYGHRLCTVVRTGAEANALRPGGEQ